MTQEMADQLGAQAAASAQSAVQTAANQGVQKASRKLTAWYCIGSLLLAAGCGFIGLVCENDLPLTFLLSQLLFFVFGIVHVMLMYKLFPWAKQYKFSTELFFSIAVMILMNAGFTIVFYIVNKNFAFLFSTSVIPFIVPLLIHWTFNFAASIPEKDYKKWIYPEKPIVTDMENIDLSNFAVITFIFSKKLGDNSKSNFQSKAPYPIKLGDLFYFFVQEWNYKNPGSTIEYSGESQPFGWYFYVKKSWWKSKEYLDADLTVKENKIAVNAIIITERVNL